MLKKIALVTAVATLSMQAAFAGMAEAEKWVNSEFSASPMTVSPSQAYCVASLAVSTTRP